MKTHHLSARTQLNLHTNQDARRAVPFASYCLQLNGEKKHSLHYSLKVAIFSGTTHDM